MTTINDALAIYIAAKEKLPLRDVHVTKVSAREGQVWSDLTMEDFSCFVEYRYGLAKRTFFMDEGDVVEFLNGEWKRAQNS